MSLEAEVDKARKRWPNQPLVLVDVDGNIMAAPIGHLFTFTGQIRSVRIVAIANADGSLTVPA